MTALSSVIMRDTHANRPAAGTAGRLYYETDTTTLFRDSGSVWENVEGGGGGGGTTPTILLDYTLATDVSPALSATTWTDLVGNQSFTVGSSSSLIEVIVTGSAIMGTGGQSCSSRFVVDSAGTPITRRLGGGFGPTSAYDNPFAGAQPIYLPGLSAASHTVKPQVYTFSAATCYCRASSFPDQESLRIQVIEHK